MSYQFPPSEEAATAVLGVLTNEWMTVVQVARRAGMNHMRAGHILNSLGSSVERKLTAKPKQAVGTITLWRKTSR